MRYTGYAGLTLFFIWFYAFFYPNEFVAWINVLKGIL